MTANGLAAYRDVLYGCRFCPMCKPAGEVSNLTMLESHTTRARAMFLWRLANGLASLGPREAELLYQSTLDSISQAWCVNHYPVSSYMTEARALAFEAGLAPEPVQKALACSQPESSPPRCEAILLAGEAAELRDTGRLPVALAALARAGVHAEVLLAATGTLAYGLGAHDQAREEARRVAALIAGCGAHVVITDGPRTLWAVQAIYPALGVGLPSDLKVISLAERLAAGLAEGRLSPQRDEGRKALVHDSRAASLAASRLARAEVIQPGYCGPEETLGEGEVFEASRRLADACGVARLYSVWSRSLAKSCGADDGLWLTYPGLAAGLAQQRVEEAEHLGAEVLITDSLLCTSQLANAADGTGVVVKWLPELIDPCSR